MNLYRGCQHGCVYCDSRSFCYRLGELSDIRYKENAIDLLTKELAVKRIRKTIGTGSMNDPYMPIEQTMKLTRSALEELSRFRFPVHIITKGTLIVRDIDILKEISKVYAAVSITITTADDKLAKQIEPGSPTTSERFKALNELAKEGIYSGITLMPILPFINDTSENIARIVEQAAESKVKYILAAFGLTLREGSRAYFYNFLDKKLPGIKHKYIANFGDQYSLPSPKTEKLYAKFSEMCSKYKIPMRMKFYNPASTQQRTLF